MVHGIWNRTCDFIVHLCICLLPGSKGERKYSDSEDDSEGSPSRSRGYSKRKKKKKKATARRQSDSDDDSPHGTTHAQPYMT